jgi:hypothetical protein
MFDAEDVDGSGNPPTDSCSPINTWVDIGEAVANNGTIINHGCPGGGVWNGNGENIDPYHALLNGTNQSINTGLDVNPGVMPESTWVAWVKPTNIPSVTNQSIFSTDTAVGSWFRSVDIISSNFAVFVGTGVGQLNWQPVSATVNTWQFIAATFTATDVFFYKNGTKFTRGTAPTVADSSQPLRLGATATVVPDEFYAGGIAWAAIYDRALTDTEVTETCKALKSRFFGALCN